MVKPLKKISEETDDEENEEDQEDTEEQVIEEKVPQKKVSSDNAFQLVEVPTQMGIAYRHISSGKTMDERELLLLIANKIDRIEKSVG